MRKRNCPLPGLVNKSPLKIDLTKKKGFGPREISEDDQSIEAARTRFEMGKTNVDPYSDFESPHYRHEVYKKTEARGNRNKVMKDGLKNKTHGAGNTGNWQAHQFRK